MSLKVKRFILIVIIALWAIMVFSFSGQDGNTSSGLSRKVVEFFIHDEQIVDIVEPYARKVAHFSEYALGGLLFDLLFLTYNWNDRKTMSISIALGIWYAITDEVHQIMVSGRNASIFDVYIDTLGFATGVCFMMLFYKIKLKLKGNNKKIKEEG